MNASAHLAQGVSPVFGLNVLPPMQGAAFPVHKVSEPGVHLAWTPFRHLEAAAHFSQGALPEALHEVPTTQGLWHTVSVVVVHASLIPASPHFIEHALQGAFPLSDHVLPASQGFAAALHTVLAVGLQAVWAPSAHFLSHFLQGALPEALHVEPAAQGTWHTVFDLAVQVSFTPAGSHLESAAHAAHFSLPVSEKVWPPMQDAASPVHTISEPGVHRALTPFVQTEAAAHFLHGALPEALHVVPAAHAMWHTVSDLGVQAVFTPAPHFLHLRPTRKTERWEEEERVKRRDGNGKTEE